MISEPTLDVIVPSYKTSSFVKEYEHQLFSPSLEGKVRFLLIDDGSPDDTYEQILAVSSRHSDYFIPFSKKNGGHGSVINFGLSKIKAPFFSVMDGDDFLKLKELEKLISFLSERGDEIDAVICDFSDVDVVSKTSNLRTLPLKEGPMTIAEIAPKSPSDEMPFLLARTFYRSEIWTQNNIKVIEGVFYDDCFYNVCAIQYIKKMFYVHLDVYQYRHFSSISEEQSTSLRSISKHSNDMWTIVNGIFALLSEETNPSALQYTKVYLAMLCWRLYLYLLIGSDDKAKRKRQLKSLDHKVKSISLINALIKKKKVVLLYRLFARNFLSAGSKIAKKFVDI